MRIAYVGAAALVLAVAQPRAAPTPAPLAGAPALVGIIKDLPADCGAYFCIIPLPVLREVVRSHNEKSARVTVLEDRLRELEAKAKAAGERTHQLQRRY